MLLSPMRYKSFVWPHNPRTYHIEYERPVAVHKVPFGRYCLQDLGPTRRVMRGEGEFVGPGAYDQFRALASVFYQEGPGLLVHPVWQCARAYFAALSLVQEPRRDYVRYTFTFYEDLGGYEEGLRPVAVQPGAPEVPPPGGGAGEQFHTVRRGENLWQIAGDYGVRLNDLIAYNPQIRNPNRIYPGERVRVRW